MSLTSDFTNTDKERMAYVSLFLRIIPLQSKYEPPEGIWILGVAGCSAYVSHPSSLLLCFQTVHLPYLVLPTQLYISFTPSATIKLYRAAQQRAQHEMKDNLSEQSGKYGRASCLLQRQNLCCDTLLLEINYHNVL